jgi:uncharacterized protein with NRDE domain
MLSSLSIKSETYGIRSFTVMTIDALCRIYVTKRTYRAGWQSPFADRRFLLPFRAG